MASRHLDHGTTTLDRTETRRGFLRRITAAAAAAGLAVLAGRASGVNAEIKQPDNGSKAEFKRLCKESGGTFKEDGLGNLECHWPSGDWQECDANGNDCWYSPKPPRWLVVNEGVTAPLGEAGVLDFDPTPITTPPAPTGDSTGGQSTAKPDRRGRKRKHRKSRGR